MSKPPNLRRPGAGVPAKPVRLPPGVANPIDVHVGERLRARRLLLGLSQEKLAHSVGLTFQQVQKYERGVNRISASRLFEFGRILDVPVAYFFEDISEALRTPEGAYQIGMKHREAPPEGDDDAPMKRRETLELVRAYYGIRDPEKRGAMYELITGLGAAFQAKAANGDGPSED